VSKHNVDGSTCHAKVPTVGLDGDEGIVSESCEPAVRSIGRDDVAPVQTSLGLSTVFTHDWRSIVREQRRSRRIAMSSEERNVFLAEERTCRVATMSPSGPHLTALWFIWDGSVLWLNSIVKSQRWTDIVRDPRVSVVVDAGLDFGNLRGVEIRGRAEVVGEVPRAAEANEELIEPERLFGVKYAGGTFVNDGRHAWLRIVPGKIVSWDFRKMGQT
jgi:hypothetical protein